MTWEGYITTFNSEDRHIQLFGPEAGAPRDRTYLKHLLSWRWPFAKPDRREEILLLTGGMRVTMVIPHSVYVSFTCDEAD